MFHWQGDGGGVMIYSFVSRRKREHWINGGSAIKKWLGVAVEGKGT